MKKALVILLAFALVFGLVFAACSNGTTGSRPPADNNDNNDNNDNKDGEDGEEGDLIETVIFNMQDSEAGTVKHEIQKLTAGKLTIGKDLPKGTDSPIKPLQEAGEGDAHVKISAVAKDGKIALEYETVAEWGAGIDLPYTAFGFLEGDKITITGEFVSGNGYAQANFKVGSEDSHGFKVSAPGPISWDIELTAALLAEIKGGDPQAIRLDGRKQNQKVRIDNIIIKGMRPAIITKLAAPTITLTGSTVSWTAIEGASGYDVYSGDELKTTITGVSINILTADEFEYDKEHTITVVAVGTKGSTSDSDPSNAEKYTKPAKEIIGFNVTVGSTPQKVEVDAVKGEVTLLAGDVGYTFKNTTEGSNINYGNAYAAVGPVNIGTGKTWNDVATIVFTWVGIGGDIGWKTGGIKLVISDEPITGYQSSGGSFANDETIPAAGIGTTLDNLTFTIKTDDSAVTALTGSSLYFVIYVHGEAHGGTPDGATEYSIKNVVFTLK